MQKAMTPEQRERKNKGDRERRAREKKAKTHRVSRGTRSEKRRAQVAAVAAKVVAHPSLKIADAIREVGLSEHMAEHPSILTSTPEWSELLDSYLPQGEVLEAHRGLLRASRVEHMQFIQAEEGIHDEDITEMYKEIGCRVKKIIHRTTGARDVYYYAPDSKARANALDMVYKLRGSYAVDKAAVAFSLASLARMRDTPALDAPRDSRTPQLPPTV